MSPPLSSTGDAAGMLLIGARFRTLAAARAALRAVRDSVPVPSGDVAVRPLGSTAYDAPEELFLLAGRFDPAIAGAVTAIIHSEGGRIIERRSFVPPGTVPASTSGPATSPRASRGRAIRLSARPTAPIAGARRGHGRARNWLRRPSPPLRVRTARGHCLD